MHSELYTPSDKKYAQAVKDSCRSLRISSAIKIERPRIERLLLSPAFLDSFSRVSKAHGLAFPLQFPSLASEINFLSVLSLLNFGSGYRAPLHEQTGRGAWDNIRALCFSLFITSSADVDYLSARGMEAVTEQVIAEHMRVSIHEERPHESIPGVTVGELGGPIHQLVKLITSTLKETGAVLVQSGYPDLGSLVYQALESARSANRNGPPDFDIVLDKIVQAIPGFRDVYNIDGQPVFLLKKALFLMHAIVVRFGSRMSTATSTLDSSNLPIFSDNVIPSMLVHLGVLDLSDSSLSNVFSCSSDLGGLLERSPTEGQTVVAAMPKTPPKDGPTLTEEQACRLRAAAVDACEMIVEVAHELASGRDHDGQSLEWMENITLPDIDLWIWSVAKDRPDYRALERFVLRDTIMF
ncbi:hypothetical protein SCHPADRAFT_845128 [Schizopora paradoxa]|uniref:Queuosine 5'-phosphate N-glycosylase/hydrolase n=1 Tax=Schizopora paradoxa TaxID=27342 RepID=A0A0H2S209_9AGAM|nr:hypothetical protein SCHPADRAFT_845128 [Schizopora paradoxa]